MTRLAIFLAALVTLVAAPVASASRIEPMPRPDNYTVIAAHCPEEVDPLGDFGCSYPDGRIFVRPMPDPYARAHAISHEMGHVFWWTMMSSGNYEWFAHLIGYRSLASAPEDINEQFAMVYANCDYGARLFDTIGTYSQHVYRVACGGIVRIGKQDAKRDGATTW